MNVDVPSNFICRLKRSLRGSIVLLHKTVLRPGMRPWEGEKAPGSLHKCIYGVVGLSRFGGVCILSVRMRLRSFCFPTTSWVCECEKPYSHTYCFGDDMYIGLTVRFLSHEVNTDQIRMPPNRLSSFYKNAISYANS